MAVDVSTLTMDNITPEIMMQMNSSEIAAFKAKLTPEQLQSLADKFGGSQAAPPEDQNEQGAPAQSNFVVSTEAPPEVPTSTAPAADAPSASETPMEQKGPITFGRK